MDEQVNIIGNKYFVHSICTLDEEIVLRYLQENFFHASVLEGHIAIKYAILIGYFNIVKFLLEKGAPVDNIDLKLISSSGHQKCMELSSHRVSQECKTFSIPIFTCDFENMQNGIEVRDTLFRRGFDSDYVPFYLAIRTGKEEVIEALLEYGADPCKSFACKRGFMTPLKQAFFLSRSAIEKIIKYAALKSKFENERGVNSFYAHFKYRNTRSILYLDFALSCMDEVKIMTGLNVNNDVTLYSFIISRGESRVLLKDFNIQKNVLKILASISLPIFKPIIVKKLEREGILNNLYQSPQFRLRSYCKDISLDFLIVDYIFNLLSKEDLINFWIALQ